MPKVITAALDASGKRFALVVSRTNEFITGRLLAGAIDALTRHGAADDALTQVWVPGAWELPLAALTLAKTRQYNAVICLGCVIRGGTPHFDYVAGETAKGVAAAALQSGVPVLFGVLTTDSLEQALERAGAKHGNKGAEAALAAIEMAALLPLIGGTAG